MLPEAATVVASYLLGSISFALLFACRRGVDLRHEGSGNPGATNAGRVLGARTGRLVMLLDGLKGFIPVVVAGSVFGRESVPLALAGLFGTLGHVLPVWHGFRGGKGAATGIGAILGGCPAAGAIAALVFFAGRKVSARASVGSLAAAAVGAALTWAIEGTGHVTSMAVGVAAIIFVRHVSNVRRLLSGEEPKA